jgi:tripartite-type tricarboxylate transporter receptor subunit TctC
VIPSRHQPDRVFGTHTVGNTPAEFAAVIKKETPEWAKVIKDAGIKLGN